MKLTYRLAKYSLLILLILLVLIISSFIVIIKTETGTRFLLSHIPGLSVEGSQGSLSGNWSAKQLIWQDDTTKIILTSPTLSWYASCLFKAHICIDQLSADQLKLELTSQSQQIDTASPNTEAISLPSIHSPVSVAIKNLSLNSVMLNNQAIVSGIKLSQLTWQKSVVSFSQLTASYQKQVNAQLAGNITLTDNWPLKLHGQLNLDPLFNQPWDINIEASGELQKQLALTINSQGFISASLQAKAAVLDKNIPAQLTLNLENFAPNTVADIPETFTIQHLRLIARGDLQQGYQLQNEATLAGHTTPVSLTIAGLATARGIQVKPLRLSTSDQHFVTIIGQADWNSAIKASAEINYQAFPWLELYPLESPPPVNLDNLQANLNYQQDNYQANLQSKLTGPAGPFTMKAEVEGNLQQAKVTKLLIDTPDQGNITGQASVTFEPNINWLANLNLQAINPNYWIPQLTGQLQGTIHSEGSINVNHINTQNKLDINGTLRKQKTLIKAELIAKNEQWLMPELLVQIGNNEIKGNAKLDKQIQAQLDLNLTALKQILPTLAGNLKGQIKLAGSLEKPEASASLTGQALGYETQYIRQLQLVASLNQHQQGTLKLQANRIQTGDTLLGDLAINSSGNLTKQQLQIQLTQGIVELLTQINSEQDHQHNWNIAINKLQINSQGQNWQLQKTALLRYTTAGMLTLNEHCLQNGQATFCAVGQQKLLPESQINYRLANFSLLSLTPWLPENFNWQGILTADIALKLPKQGPVGHININASQGIFRLRQSNEDDWQSFPYQDLYLNSELSPNKIASSLKFSGGALGHITINADINPQSHNKALTGDFKIAGFDLNIFQPFIPQLEQLTGKINGLGTISGTLTNPYISGKVAINNATAIGDLPISLEQLQLIAAIEGEELKLSGNWRSGNTGYGSLKGSVNWSKALDVNLALNANRLPVVIAPYGDLEAATDLKLKMQDNALFLTGIVQIPKGDIKVRDLPPSTVKVSSDAVIVKDQPTVTQQIPLQLNMDVDVLIGSDRLKFSGFGLTSDVQGKLKVSNNLLTHGEVSLKDGQFRAYGQRLEIRRARVIFAGSLTEPRLDIEAVREVDDVTAGLKVTGLTSQPKVTIFSSPSMSQDQALSYIILGRPMGAGDSNMLARAALVLGVAGGSPILGEIADKVGIEDFELDTAGSGDNTSVVASGKITDKLSVHYGINIFQAVNTLMVRYKLTKSVYVEAASGVASSLDLFYKKSF